MEEIREKKQEIRDEITRLMAHCPPDVLAAKTKGIEERLFEFANYLEARIALLYTPVAPASASPSPRPPPGTRSTRAP